jgi:hypothetical protein
VGAVCDGLQSTYHGLLSLINSSKAFILCVLFMSIQGLNPPTPYTGTDPTLVKLNSLETQVDMLLPQIMSGGALVGSGAAFAPGDSIGSFQAGSTAGQAAVDLIKMLLMELAAIEAAAGNSQSLWNPFSSSTASSVGDTMTMPPGWSGSSGGAGPGTGPGAGPPPNVFANQPPPGASATAGSSTGPGSSSGPPLPGSSSVGYAGNGTDEVYHVVNNTSHDEYLTYTDRSGGSTTIFLAPGQSGTIYAASSAIGDRITPEGASPNTTMRGMELFENGFGANGLQYPDVSAVDGTIDGSGNKLKILATLPGGGTIGDGGTLKHAYQFSTDDAASQASAPPGDITVTFSDG